ncbi:MAG TPA: heavy metal translocating P-type ATPase [Candidatus Limnocylindria bacterium]|nr:heavy metal translocating P-type ATPase [Candidatus Limnocylindria bacterium]
MDHDAHAAHDAHATQDPHTTHDAHGPRAPTAAEHGSHDKHAGHDPDAFRRQFWVVLALTIPVVVWSEEVQHWLGYMAPSFPGSDLIPAIGGTLVFLYGGRVFLQGAGAELMDRQPGMMTLISLAILVAFVASWAATLGIFAVDVWWELATLITVMSLGHWLEMRSIMQARGALNALAELLPDTAERIGADEAIEVVDLASLAVGDIVLVRPGGRVPSDGTVVDGTADLDESMITGESRPVTRAPGDDVIAGTVAAGGSLRVRVSAVGDQTALSGIMRLVADAQASRSQAQVLADRAAALLFYVALVAGVVTLGAWLLLGDPEEALIRTVTVLVIACPHALGLAIPLVVAISTMLGARNGLLVKDRLALERARDLESVIFDKTGTLTLGEPALAAVASAPDTDDDRVLALAAAVEADSEHPLARAIVRAAAERGVAVGPASSFEALPGRGARATVDGRTLAVGGPRHLAESGADVPADLAATAERWSAEGWTVLYLVAGTAVLGALALEDAIRPESQEAVRQLHEMGLRVAMITGDAEPVAASVARRIGIDEVAAQVLPADKADAVRRFQDGGVRVAMVGDGVNDAPALAQADVGIAIGAGTDVAVESAGIVLVRDDPRDVAGAITLSRATYRKMIENLVWATGYNAIAIPVAAGILAPWGFVLPMSVGAIAMSLSTIVVALNAQLLRRLDLRPAARPRPGLEPRPA